MDTKTNIFRDIIIGTLITAFIYLAIIAGLYPFLLLCAAPAIYYGVKNGIKYSLIISFIPAATMYFLYGDIAIIMGVLCSGVGIISASCIKRNKMITNRVVNSTAFIFIFIMLMIVVYNGNGLDGTNIIEQMDKMLLSQFSEVMAQVKEIGAYDAEQIKNIEQSFGAVVNQMKYAFPAFVLIGSFFISLISNTVATSFIRSMTTKIIAPMKISRFRVNLRFSMAALIIFLSSFILKWNNEGLYNILSTNLMMVFYVILFLQGLGVIIHWIERTSSSRIIKILVIAASVLSVYMNSLVSLVGAIDLLFNFRKIREY